MGSRPPHVCLEYIRVRGPRRRGGMLRSVRNPGAKREAYEEELLLALDEGLLSHEEAEALREEALRLERGPLELLRERGKLSEDTLLMLREELSGEDTGRHEDTGRRAGSDTGG